ncbi:hypothetical protein N9440_00290 [Alphaproteobacteria bacterium]|nr:hypothetical protein [Alphaproteobacteria bacterium]
MKLINYLYSKYLLSLLLSILVSLSIFYIFSLIGNLGENINFLTILYLSYLNAIQILLFVPSLIILLSFILMISFLRSKNEIFIIKEYFSTKKIIIYFFPIIIIYSIFEVNKEDMSKYINNVQLNLNENYKNHDFKIIVNKDKNEKTYTIIRGLNLNQSLVDEIRRFSVSEGSIISGEFSNKLILSKDKIIAHGLTKYKMDKIIRTNTSIKMIDGLDDYIDNKIIHHGNSDKNLIKLINIFFKILYLILFFYSLLLILFSKKAVNKKNNLTLPILICLLLALYSLMIISIPLNFWNSQISILALFLIFLVFFKYLSYE